MTPFDRDVQERLVGAARLAPSAHNTQPVRWRFRPDRSIELLADTSRRLPCADPRDRDLALSCGTALEGTVMALASLGVGVVSIEECASDGSAALRPVARLMPGGSAPKDPLAHWVGERHTWRGGFGQASREQMRSLQAWAATADDVHLVMAPADREWLAELNDDVTAGLLRDPQWRRELCDWMRLSRSHPQYGRDGMNRDALGMNALEAVGAGWVLGRAFPWLDRVALAAPLAAERARSLSASAIVLLHRPVEETPLQSGRVFYRRWLELTSLGFSAWPMSAAVDDPAGAARIAAGFGVRDDRRLLAAWRVGTTKGIVPARVRLPVNELIVA